MSNPKISDVVTMSTRDREVSENDTIAVAIEIMKAANYNCLLVKNDEDVAVGIISERDIVVAFSDNGDAAKSAYVHDHMIVDISVISENDTVDDALQLMAKEDLRYIPVISEAGYVTSFVSVMELLMAKMTHE